MRATSIAVLLCSLASAQLPMEYLPVPEWVKAGPMIGHVGPNSARIWIRMKKDAHFGARATVAGRAARPPRIEEHKNQIRSVLFEGLPANSEMIVQLYSGEFATRGVALTLRTAPAPAKTGVVRIGFGSCLNDIQNPTTDVLLALAKCRPDVFLFVGNSTYYARVFEDAQGATQLDMAGDDGDWVSRKRMLARQLKTRTNPWLQPLLRTVPCYAVWGEHDFGPTGADRSFANRKDSLKVFKAMWQNPAFGNDGAKGCFSSFRRGPVEVFLMDSRYHRRAANSKSSKGPAVWGKDQARWLRRALRASTAPVKLIANGSPFLCRAADAGGHYRAARREHDKLLEYLDEHRVHGVMFLTGNRLFSQLTLRKRRARATVLELSSGPLANGQDIGPSERSRDSRTVWQLRGDSFGLVTVNIDEAGAGSVTFEVRGYDGKVAFAAETKCSTTYRLADLRRGR